MEFIIVGGNVLYYYYYDYNQLPFSYSLGASPYSLGTSPPIALDKLDRVVYYYDSDKQAIIGASLDEPYHVKV